MSNYAEMVEQEAAAAEAEEEEAGDETPEPDAELEPEPEASSNAATDKAFEKIERENDRHAKRVAEIMGEDFAAVYPCQKCEGFAAGFTFDPPETAPQLVHAPEFVQCDKCNGYGLVLTGSLNEIGQTTTCRGCSGQGYKEVPLAPVEVAYAQPAVPNAAAEAMNLLRTQGFMVIEPPAQAPPVG